MRPTSFCSALLMSILLCTAYTRAQESVAGDKRAAVDASLQRMRAETWQQRSVGFYQLLRAQLGTNLNGRSAKISPAVRSLMREVPDRADYVSVALIDALRRENAVSDSSRTTEEFTSYHADLALAVAALRDKRAITVLAEILDTGNYGKYSNTRNGTIRGEYDIGATDEPGRWTVRCQAQCSHADARVLVGPDHQSRTGHTRSESGYQSGSCRSGVRAGPFCADKRRRGSITVA